MKHTTTLGALVLLLACAAFASAQNTNTTVSATTLTAIAANDLPRVLQRILDRDPNCTADDKIALRAALDFLTSGSVKGDPGDYAGTLNQKAALASAVATELESNPLAKVRGRVQSRMNYALEDASAMRMAADLLLAWREKNPPPPKPSASATPAKAVPVATSAPAVAKTTVTTSVASAAKSAAPAPKSSFTKVGGTIPPHLAKAPKTNKP